MMIKNPVSLKLMGQVDDIRQTIRLLQQTFTVVVNSRLIENQDQDGVHVFVTILKEIGQ